MQSHALLNTHTQSTAQLAAVLSDLHCGYGCSDQIKVTILNYSHGTCLIYKSLLQCNADSMHKTKLATFSFRGVGRNSPSVIL